MRDSTMKGAMHLTNQLPGMITWWHYIGTIIKVCKTGTPDMVTGRLAVVEEHADRIVLVFKDSYGPVDVPRNAPIDLYWVEER